MKKTEIFFSDKTMKKIKQKKDYVCSEEKWYKISHVFFEKNRKISMSSLTDPHQYFACKPNVQFLMMQLAFITIKEKIDFQFIVIAETKEESQRHFKRTS